ncbi:MAG: hypothetical protein ACRCZF_05185, partial [Gemmataceae bacterium]
KVDGNNITNQDRQTINVPRGNRTAILAQVNRADWGGPATVGFDALPPGVTLTTEPCDPGLGTVPMVFEAKADAPLGGVLTPLRATPTDPKTPYTSRTELDVNFNIGLNNTPFHRLLVDRMAIATTEILPFKVDVVEPKIPLVQNGSYNLKVVATRTNGFTGPITLYPLFSPPNVGITGATTIPEKVTETSIFMNANVNAAARKWKTTFIALAGITRGGPANPNDPTTIPRPGGIWAATQLFTIEVAPPLVTLVQERAAVEQGQKTQLFCKLTVATPFEGKAKAQIIGLPAKVTAPIVEFTKESKEIVLDITTDKVSPAGKHGVFIQVLIDRAGETMVHNLGGGELRIDVPLPPKTTPAPAAAPAKPAEAPKPAAPMAKRLTRLEQLRLEQEEREKAGKTAPMPAAPAPAKKEEPKK